MFNEQGGDAICRGLKSNNEREKERLEWKMQVSKTGGMPMQERVRMRI
jgi:hypothetical protein